MSSLKTSHKELLAYWNNRARSATTDCERVEWNQRTQRMRFEAFVLNHDLNGKSVLDVGCGVGDLYAHLQARGLRCDYTGFDLSPEMIQRCRSRFPGVSFESGDFLEWSPDRQFDYTVAIGIHNIKVDNVREVVQRVTQRQFGLCQVAAHLSILTDRYSGFAPHIQAWHAEEVLSLALQITPYVVLRHDYLPNDFSVTLYREPLIDTRKDLILE
jgi:ubiquinone/menaquinone biosynthesis C-methylase UbiE